MMKILAGVKFFPILLVALSIIVVILLIRIVYNKLVQPLGYLVRKNNHEELSKRLLAANNLSDACNILIALSNMPGDPPKKIIALGLEWDGSIPCLCAAALLSRMGDIKGINKLKYFAYDKKKFEPEFREAAYTILEDMGQIKGSGKGKNIQHIDGNVAFLLSSIGDISSLRPQLNSFKINKDPSSRRLLEMALKLKSFNSIVKDEILRTLKS